MTRLVGILNITPDSFSDGGNFIDPLLALKRAHALFAEGAAIVDVGSESTRPGATPLSDEEEWHRLQAVLPELIHTYPGKISLDSYHPATIEKAFQIGPVIVNDVTGMYNPLMQRLVGHYRARCIISHLPGRDIQRTHATVGIASVTVVRDDLLKRAMELVSSGVPKEHIILGPGIGFGKTTELNWQLLDFAKVVPEYPVMIGYSRKRFLGDDRMDLEPNLAAGHRAALSGAAYLRVHDVSGHFPLTQSVY